MKTIHFRSAVIAAAAVVTFAGNVAAQETPTAMLNTLEVRQLVTRGEPADDVRLSAHFSALADRYANEARRHISMSQSFVGNPSRNLGTGMAAHCKRLVDLNTESANTLRDLAGYHEELASGTAASLPKGGARFQGGAGAPEPTKTELNALAAKASTPAEHRALEEYFQTLAKRYANEANEHVTLAQTYRDARIAQAAVHRDRVASLARDAAKEATAGADMHKQLASVAR